MGLLNDLEHPPPLLLGERPRLDELHEISHLALVLFVVDLELRRPAYGFVVPRVRDLPRHRQHDRFVHLVADDPPDVRSSLFILAHTFPSAPFWFSRSLCGAASNAWGSLSAPWPAGTSG